MDSAARLSPGEKVARREFTDPARSLEDLAALARLRASLVECIRAGRSGGSWTIAGESHWLVAPGLASLAQPQSMFGVGFFGQVRERVDHGAILALEQQLLARAGSFSGLLAYYNVRFVTGQWGNLVLFAGEDDRAHVRSDPTHLEALARTGDHYRSVRLHRLSFPTGILGEAPPKLDSTLLIDFDELPPWRGVRLGPGEADSNPSFSARTASSTSRGAGCSSDDNV